MEKFGKNITRELEKIREELGLSPADLVIPHPKVEEWIEFGNIYELFDEESRLLVRNGTPVFVYIRDHTVGKFVLNNPASLNKVHFSICSTLVGMKKQGRFSRYQTTNRDDNKYTIETRGFGVRDTELYPCQNCLHELRYKGFCYDDMPPSEQRQIVRNFDAKETIGYVRQYFRDLSADLRRDFESADYPPNWRAISYSYRRRKNFTCEDCGVKLDRRLMDCHHKNGVKTDCRDENLLCLCKECHQKRDTHYKVPEEDLAIIREERRKQGK